MQPELGLCLPISSIFSANDTSQAERFPPLLPPSLLAIPHSLPLHISIEGGFWKSDRTRRAGNPYAKQAVVPGLLYSTSDSSFVPVLSWPTLSLSHLNVHSRQQLSGEFQPAHLTLFASTRHNPPKTPIASLAASIPPSLVVVFVHTSFISDTPCILLPSSRRNFFAISSSLPLIHS